MDSHKITKYHDFPIKEVKLNIRTTTDMKIECQLKMNVKNAYGFSLFVWVKNINLSTCNKKYATDTNWMSCIRYLELKVNG